jgi:hypothetical protein
LAICLAWWNTEKEMQKLTQEKSPRPVSADSQEPACWTNSQ